MTDLSLWPIGLLLFVVLGCAAALWGTRQRTKQKKTALFVLSGTKSILDAKVAVLTELLRARVTARGFSAVRAKRAAVAALRDERPASDAKALQCARSLGADYVLVVSLDDLSCQVDQSRMVNLEALRVSTTLCVAYQLLEIMSGRLLVGQTLALCRTTSPIVSGTTVGSDILDRLLGEVADRIGEHLGSLHLAA